MSFRARLLLACVPLAVIPVVLVAIGVQQDVDQRLRAQYDARVAGMVRVIEGDLERESQAIADRLSSMASSLAADNRLRLQLLGADAGDRRYLLDYARGAMRLAGLDALQLHDEDGRILSSGHFRNDFDRVDALLLATLRSASGRPVVAEVRTPDRSFPALLRIAEVRIGDRGIALVGGSALDRGFLANLDRGAGLSVSLENPGLSAVRRAPEQRRTAGGGGGTAGARRAWGFGFWPDGLRAAPDELVREIHLPFVASGGMPDGGPDATASLVITQSLEPLRELRRGIDRWFLAVTGVASAVALLIASLVASRLSRPVTELARRTQRLDLNRLDVEFKSDRRDEVGTLARTLDALAQRLRASVARLRDAERRATVGDIARQVNHDIRNGLTPIRNVVGHLAEVARTQPAELPAVFLERQKTLDASVAYLHSLAGNYARLSPRIERRPCDVHAALGELLRGLPDTDMRRVRTDLASALPAVLADPIALRRILENLVTNALESLEPGRGQVVISAREEPARAAASAEPARIAVGGGERGGGTGETWGAANATRPTVRIVVADNGHGMTPDQLDRVFDDFYTTKERGAGLGLSIVRRLVNDLGGSVRVESEPGNGTRFTVQLPTNTLNA